MENASNNGRRVHFGRRELHLLRLIALGTVALAPLAACTAKELPADAPPAAADDTAALAAKMQDRAIAVIPLDATNPECARSPLELSRDRATFAACAGLDPQKLPADYSVVADLAAWTPEKAYTSFLAVAAVDGEPAPGYLLVGFGRTSGDGMVRPQVAPLLAAGGALTVTEGIEAAGVLLAPEVVLPAMILAGGAWYLIQNRQAIADGATRLLDKVQQQLVKNPCSGGYFCTDARAASQGGCQGLVSGSLCTYKNASGTTFGRESGVCRGARSFSSLNDGTNRCVAPCVCDSLVAGR